MIKISGQGEEFLVLSQEGVNLQHKLQERTVWKRPEEVQDCCVTALLSFGGSWHRCEDLDDVLDDDGDFVAV